MPNDIFATYSSGLTSPLERGFGIIPSDVDELENVTREIFIGTGGTLVLELKRGDIVTLENLPDATRLPYRAAKVLATGTTASNIVGLY